MKNKIFHTQEWSKMKYQSVAILGAGAVGSYIIWGLTQKKDIDLCVVASGERRARYEKEGFFINDKRYDPVIKTPEEAHGVDLLIVAMKYNALRPALKDIRTVVGEKTTVISLMNGVDSEEIISEVISSDKIVHSLIKVASERDGNHVKFEPETTIGIIYGEADLSRGTERVEALNDLFVDTGLHYRATDVILTEIWSKFRLNVPNNQAQAMVGCGVGAYKDSEHMAFLRDRLREEVDLIAKAKGIDFDKSDISSTFGSKVMDRARYSTLQDLDAKRHTEVDMFAGAVVRMGRELGIPTPYNEFTYHMIKALEEKNDGKFDYK